MVMFISRLRWAAKLPLAAVATLAFGALAPGIARAQSVLVNGTRTGNAGLFTYNFAVTNNTAVDLVTFSLSIPVNTSLVSLTAPSGFLAFYEPNPQGDGSVPGSVDFLGDTGTIAPRTTLPGFSFQSTSAFTPFSLTLLDINGRSYMASGSAVNFPGITTIVAAPEPGTLGLLILASVPVAAVARRRRSLSVAKG